MNAARLTARLCALAAAAAGLTSPTAPTLADTTWTNATGNNQWSDSGNWSNGQPDSFEGVTILPNPVPGSGTITLNPSEFVDELRFDTGGYTLTGGDVFLLSGLITANGGGANPTIASQIKGLAGLTKLGTRPLNLQGNNTYTGPTEIQQNFLDVSGASERLPDSTVVIVNSGTALRFFLGAGTETIGRLVGLGDVIFANSNAGGTNLRVGSTNVDHVFEGNLIEQFGGTGKLTKIGTAQLTLTGNNTYTGGTVVSDGALVVNTTSLPAAGGVANSDVLIFDQGFDGTYGGVISGGGSLFKRGTGVLDLNQTNTYTGGTRLEAGTVAISADNNLGDAGAIGNDVTFAGGTLRIDSTSFTFSVARGFITTTGHDAVFDTPTSSDLARITGGIIGPGGLVKNGSGVLALNQFPSFYTGSTTINAGVLSDQEHEMIPDSSDVVINGGTLSLSNGVTDTIGSLSGGGSVTFNLDSFLRVGANNASTTYWGDIKELFGASGGLTKIGNGTLTLTGNNAYTEGTIVSGGRLVVDTDSLPAAGGVVNNASLEFNQTTNGTYAGVISGTGTLFKSGGGTLSLNQANTGTGPVQVLAGTLAITTVGGTLASAGTVIDTTATLRIDGGTFNANGIVGINGGRLERVSGSFNLATNQKLTASNDAVVDFTGSYIINNVTTFEINDGSDFTLTSFLDVGSGGNGTLVVDGAGSTLSTNTSATTFLDWGAVGGTGHVTIRNNATATINATHINLGRESSTGTLDIQSGATMIANTLNVGHEVSGTGTINVDGMGTSLIQNGASTLTIGGSGTSVANVNVTNQATFTTGTGPTTIHPTGTLTVDTNGTFNANGGIANNGGTVKLLGSQINAAGFTNTGTFTHEDGTLNITAGSFSPGPGTYNIDGASATDEPIVIISGTGSWTHNDPVTVGNSNKGTLRIVDTTVTTNETAVIGFNATAQGDATVTGNSAIWAISRELFVGILGDGNLTVEDGGQVLLGEGTTIAQVPSSTGMITVTGNGSTLTTTKLDVGGDGESSELGGTGTLTIGPGATVNVTTSRAMVWDDSTVTVEAGGTLNADVALFIRGEFNLNGGTLITSILDLTALGAKLNLNGGTLETDEVQGDTIISGGSFSAANVTGSLTQNGGAVTPGSSPGITAISEDYFFNAGAIQIEIAGTTGPGVNPAGHDQVAVGQTATLAGSIDVTFLDGFTPDYGDVFTILTADIISGAFSNRGEFIDAVPFTIAGQDPGVFRLGSTNVALVPLLELDPSGGGDDTVTLITTAPGDLNLDGTVNIGDFLVFQNNFNDPGNWFDGDFNGDGLVNIGDFLLLQNNFNDVFFTPPGGFPSPGTNSGGAEILAEFAAAHEVAQTPEPGTFCSLIGTAFLLTCPGTRRRS